MTTLLSRNLIRVFGSAEMDMAVSCERSPQTCGPVLDGTPILQAEVDDGRKGFLTNPRVRAFVRGCNSCEP